MVLSVIAGESYQQSACQGPRHPAELVSEQKHHAKVIIKAITISDCVIKIHEMFVVYYDPTNVVH